MTQDLVKDLAIVLAGAQRTQLGPAPHMALRRLRKALGLHETDDPQTIEATLRAALDGRPQPARREIIWREQVQPGLAVLVEDSTNILLELSTPQGQVLGRSDPVNRGGLAQSVDNAHVAATVARDQADDDRLRGLRDAEALRSVPGDNLPSRQQAVSELLAAGLPVHSAARVLRRAHGHLSATFNVDGAGQLGTAAYDRETGTYHVRVPERPASAHERHERWQDDKLGELSKRGD